MFRGVSFTILALGYVGYNLVYNNGYASEGSTANSSQETHQHGRVLSEGGCIPPANPTGLVILYVLGVLYLFVGLAIVAGKFIYRIILSLP